jgi:Putative glucoamylase
VARLERHGPSGMFYNWYDPATGAKLTTWPVDGSPVHPFLSSVDNGWMAAALLMVANAVPQLRDQARDLLAPMDFGWYHDPAAGLLRGGFWVDPPGSTCVTPGNYGDPGGAEVLYTCHHYGSLNTEPRIASYLGIAFGQVPASHYFRMARTFPPTCDWGWQEQQPAGLTRIYLGVEVFEGHYRYRGMDLVPSWGGSMFEALMVPLLVPEAAWGPRSWEVNHPLYVRAQVEHGLEEAGYGYASNNDNTLVDPGFGDCRPAQPPPPPEAYTNGVVTPHASFLALPFDRRAALENLASLRRDFDAYGEGGFYDAVNVDTGQVSRYWLALDQGMVMAALGNELTGGRLQHYFTMGAVERAVRPLLAMEEFTAGG